MVSLLGCGSRPPNAASVLLFNGKGTSPNDVLAVEAVLARGKIDYVTADSAQMNAATQAQLRRYRLLIVPGGNFNQMGEGLSVEAASNVRAAVTGGLNYLGICAGAFLAGNSGPNPFRLLPGVRFGFYSVENQGVRKAPVWIDGADGSHLEQYWEDGPQLTGWGAVVGKYPDGTPAVVQGEVGRGWIVLSGIHPEAPATWRGGMKAEEDNRYAETLVRAALTRQALPHY